MSTPNMAKNGSIDRVFGSQLIKISLFAIVQLGRCLLSCQENAIYSDLSFGGSAVHIPLGLSMTRHSTFEQGLDPVLLV